MPLATFYTKVWGSMKKGSKKETHKIYQGPDFQLGLDGIFWAVPGSKEYYDLGDLLHETQDILQEYGFKLSDLFKTAWENDTRTFEDCYVGNNLYRYFQLKVIMPDDVLNDLPSYLKNLRNKIRDLKQYKAYLTRVEALEKKIERYINEPIEREEEQERFQAKLKELLNEMDTEALLQFSRSIFVLNLSSGAWYFWLCYAALNREAQDKARAMLNDHAGLLPQYERMFRLYCYHRKEDIETQHKILTVQEKYHKDDEKRKAALVKLAVDYVERFYDKAAVGQRVYDYVRFGVELSEEDWFVLLAYEYLCEKQNIGKVEQFVLSAVGEPDTRHKDCPLEVAEYLKGRLETQIRDREDMELENFWQNEENK